MQISQAIKEFTEWKEMRSKKCTVKCYDIVLRQFCLFVHNTEIENVEFKDVMEWMKLMMLLGWERNSLIPKSMALRKFFEFYDQRGFKVLNWKLIPVPDAEYHSPRVMTSEYHEKLLAACPKESNDPRHLRNRLILMLLHDTGVRAGELLSLNISDLDLKEMRAVIRTEKAKQFRPMRQIFWSEQTNNEIKKWLSKRTKILFNRNLPDDDALFISITHQKIGKRLTISGLGEIIRRACQRAEIPLMNAHSYRHRKGHHIIKSGGSNSDVANILGHSSLQSTMVYTMMSDHELQERQKKFM